MPVGRPQNADVGHEAMNKTAMTLVTTVLLLVLGALAAGEDYEKANREGAFILAHNRYSVVSIGVDTTNPDLLNWPRNWAWRIA